MTAPRQISHYALIEPIGRDGPTEIYRARDLRLERDVAVKLLRPEEMTRPGALERFRREARTASLVSHPHICAVHDSGEEDGQAFLVCELLEGHALDEVMAGAPMANDRLLDIGVQVADALAAAHRRGVVHGKVKPSNVFITTDGHVKLLELGAATAAAAAMDPGPGITGSGTTSINVRLASHAATGEFFHPYLSPEQVAGQVGDERSDVFATGALLYEMATGRRPFTGESTSRVASEIARAEPPPPATLNPRISAGVQAIVLRALARDPGERYQSGADLLEDLKRARRAADQHGPATPAGPLRRRAGGYAAIAVALLAAISLAATARWWWNARTSAPVPRNTVLVSDIANGTGDPDFDDTLRQAVTVYLAQSPYLNLVSEERVRGALRLMGRPLDTRLTHEVAMEVCQRLGLQAMLEGSVSAVGHVTLIALAATDCATDDTIDRQQIEVERKEDVLSALGKLTGELRTSLGESVASLASHNVPIENATTPSLEALKAYTEAARRRAEGSELEAIPLLERAIAIDPGFALAYTTLSSVYGSLGETGRSEEYARLAYENRGRVSEGERLFITYQFHDRVTGDQLKAREALEVWKRTYPADYRPPNALAVLHNRLGGFETAAAEAQEAIRRNPAHAFPYSNLAHALRGAGRYAEAREIADDAISRGLETVPMRRLLYQIAEIEGDAAAAARHLGWGAERRRAFDLVGTRAQIAAFHGRLADARALYAQTGAAARAEGFAQIASGYASQAALIEALYGQHGNALAAARQVIRGATALEPAIRAATALALAGAPDEAEPVVGRIRGARPGDTLLLTAYVPVAEATILLARGRYARAIEQLRPAVAYEQGFVAALAPAYFRAEALFGAGDYPEAVAAYRSVIERRGSDPYSPFVPLSYVGLVRTHSQAGDTVRAGQALAALDALWTDADPEVRLLRDRLPHSTASPAISPSR